MVTTPAGTPTGATAASVPPSLEQRILAATAQAAQIVDGFSPAAAQLIAEGVAVEPILSMFGHGIVSIFHHHTVVKPPTAPAKA